MTRSEGRLAQVFVELADTLIAEFDVIDFLYTLVDRTVELLPADAAGVVLADQRGQLRVLASSAEQARLLELFELQNSEGPCLDCYNSGEPVVNVSSEDVEARWPRFSAESAAAGFRSVHALPLRLRAEVIGAMNLFCAERSRLSEQDVALGQALSDIATIGLLQERAIRDTRVLVEQLQTALNNRVLLEQAKGVLAERGDLDIDVAFTRMRGYARASQRKLSEVAAAVIDGSLPLTELESATPQATA